MLYKTLLVVLICTVLVSGTGRHAEAGGIMLYELATPDVGRASAGWAARAGDASTLFKNPAGMSRLPGKELQAGVQALYGQYGFKPNQNTTVTGNDGGNPIGWLPSASVFYTHELGSDWNVGIGAFSYFGLAAEYDQGWVGRYYVQENALVGVTLMPAVSYRVNEQFSFGAGLNWMFGIFEQKSAVKNIVQQTDGSVEFSDNTQGFGANVGALWEVNGRFRIGLTYLSQVTLDFKDTPEFSGLGTLLEAALGRAGVLGAELDLGLNVPHSVTASAYHEVSDEVAVMGNLGWQNWNGFGKVDVALGDTLLALTTDLDYKDTWHVAGGVEWDVAEQWLVTGGIAYDSSPVDDANRALQLPMGKMIRIGAGGQWTTVSEAIKLGFAYQLIWAGDLAVDQFRQIGNQVINRVAGGYENAALHTFVVNLVWDI